MNEALISKPPLSKARTERPWPAGWLGPISTNLVRHHRRAFRLHEILSSAALGRFIYTRTCFQAKVSDCDELH
jgi:hypothetical protein